MTPTPEEVRAAQVKRILDERAAALPPSVGEAAALIREALEWMDPAAVGHTEKALAALDVLLGKISEGEPLTEAELRAREEAWGERYAADAAGTEPHGESK